MQDDSHGPCRPGCFATGSPRPVESRKRCEAGLLACTAGHQSRWDGAFPRVRSGCAEPFSAYSCGGSRGLYRVPVLARASAREPRTGKATQCLPGGQPPRRLTQARPRDLLAHCVQVPPTGVKRETGASRLLEEGDKAGAAPATVSERSVQTTVPIVRHGKVALDRWSPAPPRQPGDRPDMLAEHPAVGGRCRITWASRARGRRACPLPQQKQQRNASCPSPTPNPVSPPPSVSASA
ncbi:hypothetical protein ACVWY1_003817 [Pseudomonas sp. TE6288]